MDEDKHILKSKDTILKPFGLNRPVLKKFCTGLILFQHTYKTDGDAKEFLRKC